MRITSLLMTLAIALLFATPSLADQSGSEKRYVSPSGAFSISMESEFPLGLSTSKETSSGTMVLVDFSYRMAGIPLVWQRSIEWIKLDRPVDALQMDGQATDTVNGYLEGRFGAGTLVVSDRGKSRDADGRLVYAFAARGRINHYPAIWQGAVLFFDNGIAFASQVLAQPTNYRFDPQGGVIDQSVVNWAKTIRPGTQ